MPIRQALDKLLRARSDRQTPPPSADSIASLRADLGEMERKLDAALGGLQAVSEEVVRLREIVLAQREAPSRKEGARRKRS